MPTPNAILWPWTSSSFMTAVLEAAFSVPISVAFVVVGAVTDIIVVAAVTDIVVVAAVTDVDKSAKG